MPYVPVLNGLRRACERRCDELELPTDPVANIALDIVDKMVELHLYYDVVEDGISIPEEVAAKAGIAAATLTAIFLTGHTNDGIGIITRRVAGTFNVGMDALLFYYYVIYKHRRKVLENVMEQFGRVERMKWTWGGWCR